MRYLNHPYADLFPMACVKDFGYLTHSIGKIGLIEPIVIYQDMVLDGRNRYDACTNAHVEPHYTFFEGNDADALNYVLAKNYARRNLTASQRAIVAAKLVEMKFGDNQHTKEGSQNCPPSSISAAAEKLSVSPSSVKSAKRVISSGDKEVIAAVENGEVAVNVAAEVVQLPKEERPKALSERAKSKGPRLRVVNDERALEEKIIGLLKKASPETCARIREYLDAPVFDRGAA